MTEVSSVGSSSPVISPDTQESNVSTSLCATICHFIKTFFVYLIYFSTFTLVDLREKEIVITATSGDVDSPRPDSHTPTPTPAPRSSTSIPSTSRTAPSDTAPLVTSHTTPPGPAHLDTAPLVTTITTTALPTPVVSSHASTVATHPGMPTKEQCLKLKQWIYRNARAMENKVDFTLKDGTPILVWKSYHTDAINIQGMIEFADDLLLHRTSAEGLSSDVQGKQKLGLMINDQGKITSVYVDNQDRGTDFPAGRVAWMQALKEAVLSAEDAANLELEMRNELKEKHKGMGAKAKLTVADGTELYIWYNSQYEVVLVQQSQFFGVSAQGKIGIKIDDNGDFTSIHYQGGQIHELSEDQKTWMEEIAKRCFNKRRKRLLAEAKPEQKFDRKDLCMFKAYLNADPKPTIDAPKFFTHEGTRYGAWIYQDEYFIQKEDQIGIFKADPTKKKRKDQLALKISNTGNLERFLFQGIPFKRFCKPHIDLLNTLLMSIVEEKTSYSSSEIYGTSQISAYIIKQAIPRGVKLHLDQYSEHLLKLMDNNSGDKIDPKLDISFIDEHLQPTGGIDAGGLSRSYFPDVVGAICDRQHPDMHVVKRGNANRPITKMEPDGDEPEKRMSLTPEEESAWEKLGHMMMHCYHTEDTGHYTRVYVLGTYFDETLYQIMLWLSPSDIQGGVENLPQDTYLQMIKHLIKEDSEGAIYVQTLDWIKKEPTNISDDKVAEAFYTAGGDCEDWGSECFSSEDDAIMGVDVSKVREKWAEVKQGLVNSIFASQYAREIAPAMAIAKGLFHLVGQNANLSEQDKVQAWNNLRFGIEVGPTVKKIQGTIDRAEIVSKIQLEGSFNASERQNIEQKIEWIKTWIGSDLNSTEDEVKGFLRFVSGGVSLPSRDITVQRSNDPSPLPNSHTCSVYIDIKPTPTVVPGFDDTTYDGFINCLKASMATDGIIG